MNTLPDVFIFNKKIISLEKYKLWRDRMIEIENSEESQPYPIYDVYLDDQQIIK